MCFLTVWFADGSKQYLTIPLLEIFSSTAVADLSTFRRKSILQLALVDLYPNKCSKCSLLFSSLLPPRLFKDFSIEN